MIKQVMAQSDSSETVPGTRDVTSDALFITEQCSRTSKQILEKYDVMFYLWEIDIDSYVRFPPLFVPCRPTDTPVGIDQPTNQRIEQEKVFLFSFKAAVDAIADRVAKATVHRFHVFQLHCRSSSC